MRKSLDEEIRSSGVAVWHFRKQEFVPFIPCPGEKRVRLDVHDSLDNYGVYAATYAEDGTFSVSGPADNPTGDPVELNWVLSLS